MQRTRVGVLALITVVTALVGWLVVAILEGRGIYLSAVPPVVDVTILALAAVVGWLGWTVRAYLRGKRPTLGGLRAARTLVLAKAAALTGSLLTGWYVAQILIVLPDLVIEPRRERAIAAAIAAGCAAVLVVVAMVAERFCQLPPGSLDDPEAPPTQDPGAESAGTAA